MMEPQREAYRTEAYELLAELETSLLALEEDPADMELIGRVFRALHTIKGSGAMFGFDDIAAFTHDVETVFDLVRNEKLGVTKMLVDLALRAGDQIRGMLDGTDGGAEADTSRAGEITSALRELIPKLGDPAVPVPQKALPATEDEQVERTYRIFLRLDREIFSRGANPVLLLNELRELGECSVIAHTEAIPNMEDLDPEQCHISWDVVLTTRRGIDAIKDVFIFVEDECELTIEVIDDYSGLEDDELPRKGSGRY
jgi:two-component system chemotaxis sensor kinase CheA